MQVKAELKIDKNDRCGSVHPVYSVIEELTRLGEGEAIAVSVNDEDWIRTLKSVADLRGVSVIEAGEERGYWRFILVNRSGKRSS
ncbi:hypothetical protein GCM10007981_05140 [Thermocladium modestius]|uniref:Uncharacterized protein n=1 Tax=Thermocladium modestius TaxID=62609 RepID=A0A830GTY8_9CREN|nr:hypothetical protein [Thermocladium modestius]GGP19839.1 hypothetical protein GCM10007981_05140 [Thermocladium modestius]